MIEIHHKNGDDNSSGMCRSKSNVEICRYRRKRSKTRKDTLPSSCSDDESSSESYCGHGKHFKKRCHRHRRSLGKGNAKHGKKDDSPTPPMEQKESAEATAKGEQFSDQINLF